MALTEIGRWNLGGAPFYPAMKAEGVLLYMASNIDVRLAIFGVSDAALGTVLHPGTRTMPYTGEATIINDYYLPPFNQDPYASPWISAIHTGTGALIEFNAAIATWGSYQARAHEFPVPAKTFQASLVANNGSVGSASTMHGSVPPIAATGWGSGALGGDMPGFIPSTAKAIRCGATDIVWYIDTSHFTADPFVTYMRAYRYVWNGADAVVTWTPRFGYLYLNKTNAGPNMSTVDVPNRVAAYNGRLYCLIKSSAGTQLYMATWYLTDLEGATPYLHNDFTLTTLNSGAGFGAPNPCTVAFHIDPTFGKVYTVNDSAMTTGPFPRANDLYHAFAPWTTPQVQVLADAGGPTNARITGIWTFPPYVYITKMAGVAFGNQLIKFYDPDLNGGGGPGGGTGHGKRRRGGEFWGIIPEVASYIG